MSDALSKGKQASGNRLDVCFFWLRFMFRSRQRERRSGKATAESLSLHRS
jgi:hypothetical protein